MTITPIQPSGPHFQRSEHMPAPALVKDATGVYAVTVQHFPMSTNGYTVDDGPELYREPMTYLVGYVWRTVTSDGWCAATHLDKGDNGWSALVDRAIRSLPTLEGAQMMLYGAHLQRRADAVTAARSRLPWMRDKRI